MYKTLEFLIEEQPKFERESSSTSLVGTTPQKSQVQAFEDIYNNKHTINITITYNLSYCDTDTLYEGPKSVQSILGYLNNERNKITDYVGWKSFYFVNEKHKNDKRWHMHGQLLLRTNCRSESIRKFKVLYKKLNTVGRCSLKWNNPDYEVKSDQHKTYTQYCFKESNNTVLDSIATPLEHKVFSM